MIQNNLLSSAEEVPIYNRGGEITPKFVVMHYTAGTSAQGAINAYKNRKVSAHVTIDTDGTVYQHVPFNIAAWHAGPSSYGGYHGLNNHSIGIELVNTGWLKKGENSYYRNSLQVPLSTEVIKKKHSRVGSGYFYWPVFPDVQLNAAKNVVKVLLDNYDILDIVSHEEIDTRGWKTDPGPAFPMEEFKRILREEDTERHKDFDMNEVNVDSLNMRTGPGTEFEIVGALSRGSIIGTTEAHGSWRRLYACDCWVHGAYLRRV